MVGERSCFGHFFSCAEDLPLAVLLLFCSEGDNIPDALTLVNQLNDWLHLLDNSVSSSQELQKSTRTNQTLRGQFSQNHKYFPPFLPPVREILLVPFKYDLVQKRAPFTLSFSLIQISQHPVTET